MRLFSLPSPLVLARWAQVQSSHNGDIFFPSQGWIGSCHCWVPSLPASEKNTEFLKLHILQGGQLATRLITLNCLHHGRNSVLFLLEWSLLCTLTCLLCLKNFCHSTVSGLTECLIYCCDILIRELNLPLEHIQMSSRGLKDHPDTGN